MHTRRAVLATAVVGVSAGCLGDHPDDDPAPAVSVDISVVDHVSDDAPVTFELDQATKQLSADALPRFSFGMRNVSDTVLEFVDWAPGLLRPGESIPGGFVILGSDEADRVVASESEVVTADLDGCLYIDELPERDADEWWTTLEPENAVSADFAFVPIGAPDGDCPAHRDYSFAMAYDFYEEAAAETDEPAYELEWGFTITVRDP